MDAPADADVGPRPRGRFRKARRSRQGGPPPAGGAVYGIGMIGALVYFLRSAEDGWDYVLAFPRAIFWPALLVYKLLRSLDR
jgi:hypothetical protein